MEKKYQVFVSSTYQDLIEERQKVIEALLGKNCFPIGMEYFPASNDDQFTVIKKLIDQCDYYILIIGGRYGSVEKKSGKSYTQLEFEYAVSKNIPVACFYHEDPNNLTANKVEGTDEGKKKLEDFKKIIKERLCNSWKEPYELAFKVNKALDSLFENNSRTGWVRADLVASDDANKQILKLKNENDELKKYITENFKDKPNDTEDLSQGDDIFEIKISHVLDEEKVSMSWNELFKAISPYMINEASNSLLRRKLIFFINDKLAFKFDPSSRIKDEDFYTIIIQFNALGLITQSNKTRAKNDDETYWTLTPYGTKIMFQIKALKKK